MDQNHEEPPRPPNAAPLRSQTTLRTLFATTAICALVSSSLIVPEHFHLIYFLLTPCATAFVAGLFGLSLPAGFGIGFFTISAFYVFLLATSSPYVFSWEWVLRNASKAAVPQALFIGPSWLTACWWGLYLRYAWSNAGKWPPRIDNNTESTGSCDWINRDRLMVRCATAPVGFLIISLLITMSLTVFGLCFMSEARY